MAKTPFAPKPPVKNAYTFDKEDCPKCGASMEGDPYSGECNSCGHKWGEKIPTKNEGTPMRRNSKLWGLMLRPEMKQLAVTGNLFCPTGPGGGVDASCTKDAMADKATEGIQIPGHVMESFKSGKGVGHDVGAKVRPVTKAEAKEVRKAKGMSKHEWKALAALPGMQELHRDLHFSPEAVQARQVSRKMHEAHAGRVTEEDRGKGLFHNAAFEGEAMAKWPTAFDDQELVENCGGEGGTMGPCPSGETSSQERVGHLDKLKAISDKFAKTDELSHDEMKSQVHEILTGLDKTQLKEAASKFGSRSAKSDKERVEGVKRFISDRREMLQRTQVRNQDQEDVARLLEKFK